MKKLSRKTTQAYTALFDGTNLDEMLDIGNDLGVAVYFRGAQLDDDGNPQSAAVAVFQTPGGEVFCYAGNYVVSPVNDRQHLQALSPEELKRRYY